MKVFSAFVLWPVFAALWLVAMGIAWPMVIPYFWRKQTWFWKELANL